MTQSRTCKDLTKKERAVLDALLDLVEPHKLHDYLCIKPNTVETHLRNIRAKLGVSSTIQAICIYIRIKD